MVCMKPTFAFKDYKNILYSFLQVNRPYTENLFDQMRRAVRRIYQITAPLISVWPVVMTMPLGSKHFWWVAEVSEH